MPHQRHTTAQAEQHAPIGIGSGAVLDPERETTQQESLNECHLFAGCGGGILAGVLLGHRPVVAVEIEPYCREVLAQRQRDGILPTFAIHDDVRTFDGKPWRGKCDVVAGGFPCQDISACGTRAGIDGERSGLWREMSRIIGEIRPRYAFIENSPDLAFRGLDRVLCDLARMGYDARWGVFSACSIGAPHSRERMFLLADAEGWATGQPSERQGRQDTPGGSANRGGLPDAWIETGRAETFAAEPDVVRLADGAASRLERLKATGNGQVPAVAALAWQTLERGFGV